MYRQLIEPPAIVDGRAMSLGTDFGRVYLEFAVNTTANPVSGDGTRISGLDTNSPAFLGYETTEPIRRRMLGVTIAPGSTRSLSAFVTEQSADLVSLIFLPVA